MSYCLKKAWFPSKLIEFSQFGKPLVVWGQEYCSAVERARREDSALCVTDQDLVALVAALNRLADSRLEQERLAAAADRAAVGEFDSLAIQAAFQDLLAACSTQATT